MLVEGFHLAPGISVFKPDEPRFRDLMIPPVSLCCGMLLVCSYS